MARLSGLCIFALLFASSFAQVTFTGNATKDFDPTNLSEEARLTLKTVKNTNTLVGSAWMESRGLISGFDIDQISLQYEWTTDTLYASINCFGICGDADGDGDPGVSTDRGSSTNAATPPSTSVVDRPKQAGTESTVLLMWTGTPKSYIPNNDGVTDHVYYGYYPDIIIGDGQLTTLDDFNSYALPSWDDLEEDEIKSLLDQPSYFITPTTQTLHEGNPAIPNVILSAHPNATWQDLEFKVPGFSLYGSFNFVPGHESVKIAFTAYSGGLNDAAGEDHEYPFVYDIPCLVFDRCGVCNGSNECVDCNDVPDGTWEHDECNVCRDPLGADWNECDDCNGTPFGNWTKDRCEVCLAPNDVTRDACVDCNDVPDGTWEHDECNMCRDPLGADWNECDDCNGTPFGNWTKDRCEVCLAPNDVTRDACVDCNDVANGGWKYDECEVCGDPNGPAWNQKCADCNHVPNGDWKEDQCGDCADPNGPLWNAAKDACGRCDGDGQWCRDCNGTVFGHAKVDSCNVCGGDGKSCLDCEGTPFGDKQYDYCGVCGGDNTACDCYFESTLVFYPEDTWIELNDRLANHCPDDTLYVKNNRDRTLVQFRNITHRIRQEHIDEAPGVATEILSATLTFTIRKVGGGWEDSGIALHQIPEFDCPTATWDCSEVDTDGCCSQWRMIALPPQVNATYLVVPTDTQELYDGQTGELVFDVIDDVEAIYEEDSQAVLAYLLKKVCEHDSGFAAFWSSETCRDGPLVKDEKGPNNGPRGEHVCTSPRLEIRLHTPCPVPERPAPGEPCPDPQRDNGDWSKW